MVYVKNPASAGKETEEIMRKSITVFIVLAVLAAGGAAWALDTNTLTVNASVVGTCKFSAATSTLNFGALDPSTPVAVNGSAAPQFWCTKGVATDVIIANLGLNQVAGVRQMKDTAGGGTDLIPYSLTLTPSAGPNLGPGSPRTLNIAGIIAANTYSGVAASTYSDTVTLSITP
jgi:spore coat protein U-like protein